MSTDGRDPLILARTILGVLLFAALAVYFHQAEPRDDRAAFFCLTTCGALLLHSGRRRRRRNPSSPASPGAAGLPPLCLAALAFAGACEGGGVHWNGWRGSPAPQEAPGPQFAAGHIALIPQGSSPIPASTAGLYAKSSDNLPRLVGTDATEYVAGTAWRLKQGAPGSPTEGDLWYDSSAGAAVIRNSVGNVTLANAASYVALTGTQSAAGNKTWSGLANFTGGLSIAGAPQTGASFFKTCTITSAAAATPVVCLSAADVPASLSAKLAKWSLYVNGSTGWGTTATCVIEDTSGNDLVSIAVAAMTGDTFVGDHSANVTPAARYRLGTGGAADAGLQISCNANGTGSDAVFVLSGSVQ